MQMKVENLADFEKDLKWMIDFMKGKHILELIIKPQIEVSIGRFVCRYVCWKKIKLIILRYCLNVSTKIDIKGP